MADKREPCVIILLRISGKGNTKKVELFKDWLWPDEFKRQGFYRAKTGCRYRLRVKGKWFCRPEQAFSFFTKTEVKNLLFRSIKIK